MIIMPFDSETSGIPDWKMPSESPHQPHLVTLAALLVSDETGEILDSMDVIIKPDGWTISQETIDIHGITQERAMDEGIPEVDALDMLLGLWRRCDLRTAFNTTFDNRMIRIAMKRYMPDQEALMEYWRSEKDKYYCTMINARKVMGGKQPTLNEAHRHFFGTDVLNAHTAMGDTVACNAIYFALNPIMETA